MASKAKPKTRKAEKQKPAKQAAQVPAVQLETAQPITVDLEELEEAQEEAAATSQNNNAAALAAATAGGSNEMSASFKNFRHHPDMENFYRFIYENDLRHEALAIIDKIVIEKQKNRTIGKLGKAAASH